METLTKKSEKGVLKQSSDRGSLRKKESKTWLAALENVGTGKILDMKAVLK